MNFQTVERTPGLRIQKMRSLFSGKVTHNPVSP
jgi:hypothetical protein